MLKLLYSNESLPVQAERFGRSSALEWTDVVPTARTTWNVCSQIMRAELGQKNAGTEDRWTEEGEDKRLLGQESRSGSSRAGGAEQIHG